MLIFGVTQKLEWVCNGSKLKFQKQFKRVKEANLYKKICINIMTCIYNYITYL